MDGEEGRWVPKAMRRCLARDSQVSRLYSWEDEWGLSKAGPLRCLGEAEDFLRKLYEGSGLRPPPVRENRRLRSSLARYQTAGAFIEVSPERGMFGGVLLHEACHHLTNQAVFPFRRGEEVAWHGPEFAGLLLHLGAALTRTPLSVARDRADRAGVRWSVPSPRGLSIFRSLLGKRRAGTIPGF